MVAAGRPFSAGAASPRVASSSVGRRPRPAAIGRESSSSDASSPPDPPPSDVVSSAAPGVAVVSSRIGVSDAGAAVAGAGVIAVIDRVGATTGRLPPGIAVGVPGVSDPVAAAGSTVAADSGMNAVTDTVTRLSAFQPPGASPANARLLNPASAPAAAATRLAAAARRRRAALRRSGELMPAFTKGSTPTARSFINSDLPLVPARTRRSLS
jgi:hypothetical protein